MSLISDALKTAQRERTSRSQAEKHQQPVVDGFFPYVASAPARRKSRRSPAIIIGAAAVALLAATAWLAWPHLPGRAVKAKTPTIILPPPVTVTQSPSRVDTTAVITAQTPAPQRQAPSPAPSQRVEQTNPPARETRPASRPNVRPAEVLPVEPEKVERPDAIPSVPARTEAVRRVDYEAQATALFNAGDLVGARDKFQLATQYAPTARAWTNYGVTLQRLGDNVGASSAYQAAIGIDANYLEAWLFQGRLAAGLGDVARAVPLFQRARAINPRNADVNVELARLEYDAKNWTEARKFAEEAVRGDPTSARGHWYIGAASDQLKDVAGAIRGYSGYLQYVGDARDQAVFVGWARTRLAELRGKE